MRTNLGFRFVVDVMSQALLYLYLPQVDVLRKYAIRSSMDAADLYNDFTAKSEKDEKTLARQKRATAVVDGLSAELKLSPSVLLKILCDVEGDPANKFLTALTF